MVIVEFYALVLNLHFLNSIQIQQFEFLFIYKLYLLHVQLLSQPLGEYRR